ncbi:hypothetical protein KIPB_012651, partial [Kipferlia bialata]|eukprot:g12651.t1
MASTETPWYTDCTVLEGLECPYTEDGAEFITAVSLGNNTAMLAFMRDVTPDSDDTYTPREEWYIVSLSRYPASSIEYSRIPGPRNPEGVVGMKLVRVGDVVVAYGGRVFGPRSDPFEQHPPHWYMAVYTIATGVWENIPYEEGCMPLPAHGPTLFAVEDTLVVAGGTPSGEGRDTSYDTHEWCLSTSLSFSLSLSLSLSLYIYI